MNNNPEKPQAGEGSSATPCSPPSGMHTDHICHEDGTVDDTPIETFYAPCTGGRMADGYLRIFADYGATDIETRVSFASLIAMGWTAPKAENMYSASKTG